MKDEIFKISKNEIRARSLVDMASDRFKDIDKESKIYKIVEEYYEVIKELITALMYIDGLKTLSHKMLIVYLEETYKDFNKPEIMLVDELRVLRNNILYYGQKVEKEFLINNEDALKDIIDKLFKILKNKLK